VPTKPTRRKVQLVLKNILENLKPSGTAYRPYDSPIPCNGLISERKGSDVNYSYIAGGVPWLPKGEFYVTLIGVWLGAAVPTSHTATANGYSFDGYLLFCLAEFCKNGQLMAFQIYIAGEVNTSSEPDELSFTYAINLNCGGKLTCTENGTFKGTAKAARSTAWRDRSMVSKSGQ
jgi:hypothetical protein